MKIYLAGPMSGYPRYNFPLFDSVALKLRQQGHHVFSPADADRQRHGLCFDDENDFGVFKDSKVRREAIAEDVAWICKHAEAMVLLPGWERSTGASMEYALAVAIGIRVMTQEYEEINEQTISIRVEQ